MMVTCYDSRAGFAAYQYLLCTCQNLAVTMRATVYTPSSARGRAAPTAEPTAADADRPRRPTAETVDS